MMKKIFVLFLLLGVVLCGDTFAQRRSYSRNRTNNTFRFTDDMVAKINKSCPATVRRAQNKSEKLEAYCSVRNVEFGESDLGPWKKIVSRFEKLFKQFRRIIYTAAVFMVLWIFVKAAYEGDMKWMHIAMLVMGVVILSFAEVLLAMATNRITIEDVLNNGVYVDCRDRQMKDAYFKCSTDGKGASLYDSRYFLQITGEANRESYSYRGLY